MLTRKTITLKNKFFVFKKTKSEINNIPYTAIFTSSIPPGQISHIIFLLSQFTPILYHKERSALATVS